jgi:hypothetical protein
MKQKGFKIKSSYVVIFALFCSSAWLCFFLISFFNKSRDIIVNETYSTDKPIIKFTIDHDIRKMTNRTSINGTPEATISYLFPSMSPINAIPNEGRESVLIVGGTGEVNYYFV